MWTAIIIPLCGGLGLFLYGMHMMSEGIERAAGAKLRSILEFFTKNTFTGLIVGIVFTAIIQSSSACTVMVVTFVNSGIMNLYQAIGVIFGANIGTTVTSQLVSFDLAAYAPIFVLAGVGMMLFVKKVGLQKVGQILAGFGILFMGIESMASSMGNIKEVPAVLNALSLIQNPFMALFVGLAITAIVQSSSVTVSIILLMAAQGLMDLNTCCYFVQGCNLGACTSALLASLSGKKDAKRAALLHLLFNVFGVALACIMFATCGDWFVEKMLAFSGGNKGRFVANMHTIIRVAQVVVLFPFTSAIVKLTQIIIPGQDEKISYRQSFQLKYISDKKISPATAYVDVCKELDRMATLASENLNRGMNALITLDEDDIEEVYKVEENINYLNHAITDYLVKISQTNLPVQDAKTIGALFHVVNDIERIGDHAENMADSAKLRLEKTVDFSKVAQHELGTILDKVNNMIRYSMEMFAGSSKEHLEDMLRLEDEVDRLEREYQQNHVDRLTKGDCSAGAGMIFSDVVSGLERVADHATNIAFALCGDEVENEED